MYLIKEAYKHLVLPQSKQMIFHSYEEIEVILPSRNVENKINLYIYVVMWKIIKIELPQDPFSTANIFTFF